MQPLQRLRARVTALGPGCADALLGTLYLVEAELEVILLMPDGAHAGLAALCVAAVAAGLALRRRAPLAALVLAMIGLVAVQPLGREVSDHIYSMLFALLFLLFSTGLHLEGRRLAAAGVVTVAAIT